MEQQHPSTPEPQQPQTQSPSPAPRGIERCRARTRSGSRCRLHVQDPARGLCFRHLAGLSTAPPNSALDDADLSMDLFGQSPVTEIPPLQTPEDVTDFLARVVVLLVEGRISPRRASVLTYAASLLLRGAIFIDQHTETEIILDDRRPTYDSELGHSEEPSPVLTEATR